MPALATIAPTETSPTVATVAAVAVTSIEYDMEASVAIVKFAPPTVTLPMVAAACVELALTVMLIVADAVMATEPVMLPIVTSPTVALPLSANALLLMFMYTFEPVAVVAEPTLNETLPTVTVPVVASFVPVEDA